MHGHTTVAHCIRVYCTVHARRSVVFDRRANAREVGFLGDVQLFSKFSVYGPLLIIPYLAELVR